MSPMFTISFSIIYCFGIVPMMLFRRKERLFGRVFWVGYWCDFENFEWGITKRQKALSHVFVCFYPFVSLYFLCSFGG